jgi:hypothetical protein
MVVGTTRAWKGRVEYLGSSEFEGRSGMKEMTDRGLALEIGGLVGELGSGWGLGGVRRLDRGLLEGVEVVGRRWMEVPRVVVGVVGLMAL